MQPEIGQPADKASDEEQKYNDPSATDGAYFGGKKRPADCDIALYGEHYRDPDRGQQKDVHEDSGVSGNDGKHIVGVTRRRKMLFHQSTAEQDKEKEISRCQTDEITICTCTHVFTTQHDDSEQNTQNAAGADDRQDDIANDASQFGGRVIIAVIPHVVIATPVVVVGVVGARNGTPVGHCGNHFAAIHGVLFEI